VRISRAKRLHASGNSRTRVGIVQSHVGLRRESTMASTAVGGLGKAIAKYEKWRPSHRRVSSRSRLETNSNGFAIERFPNCFSRIAAVGDCTFADRKKLLDRWLL